MMSLGTWGKNWSLKFNTDKCEVLRITREKEKKTFYNYKVNITQSSTEAAKYRGITIRKDLNWSKHIRTS